MELDKIKKVKLHSEVSRVIVKYIEENNLHPKDKLPSERVLAEKLGIGRSSLREALRVLESQGVIEVISGKGIFVGKRETIINDNNALVEKLKKRITLLELYQIRRPLGALSIQLASINASEEEKKVIKQKLENYEKEYTFGNPGIIQDRALHMSIHKASGNYLLYTLFEYIFMQWDSFEFENATAFPDSVPLHRPVVEAIISNDPKKAVRSYHKLMDYVEQRIMDLANTEE
jgi:GntR family transcriptional regulator, transcriptional repressor for pyruvate dehydrogenase complex